jgi:hypothetical protein
MNRVERRCDELMITVALAKEEREKLVLLVEKQTQDKEHAIACAEMAKEKAIVSAEQTKASAEQANVSQHHTYRLVLSLALAKEAT